MKNALLPQRYNGDRTKVIKTLSILSAILGEVRE